LFLDPKAYNIFVVNGEKHEPSGISWVGAA